VSLLSIFFFLPLCHPQKAVEYLGADPHALTQVLGPAALAIAPPPRTNRGHLASSSRKPLDQQQPQLTLPPWRADDSRCIRAPLGHWRSCERELPGGGGVGDRGVGGEDMLHVGALMATMKMAGKVKRRRTAKKSQQHASRSFEDFLGSLGSGTLRIEEELEEICRRSEEEEDSLGAQAKGAWNFVAHEKEAQRALLLKRHHTIATERLTTGTPSSISKQVHESEGARQPWAWSTSSRSSAQELGSSFDNRLRNRDEHDASAESAEVAMEQTRQRGAIGRAMVEARAEAARRANGEVMRERAIPQCDTSIILNITCDTSALMCVSEHHPKSPTDTMPTFESTMSFDTFCCANFISPPLVSPS